MHVGPLLVVLGYYRQFWSLAVPSCYALWRTESTSLILPFLLGKAIVFTPPNVIVGDVGVNQEVSTTVSDHRIALGLCSLVHSGGLRLWNRRFVSVFRRSEDE